MGLTFPTYSKQSGSGNNLFKDSSIFPTPAETFDDEVIVGQVKPRTTAYYVGGDYTEGTVTNSIVETTLLSFTIPAYQVVNGIKITAVVGNDYENADSIFRIKSTTGVEKLTNGTFTGSANSWTLGAAWAYNTNLVRKNADGTNTLSQPIANMVTPMVNGQNYELVYTLSNFTVGSFTPSIGGATLTTRTAGIDANGTYRETFTCSDKTLPITFTPTNTARFYIDTVSLMNGGEISRISYSSVGAGNRLITLFLAVTDTLDWEIIQYISVTGQMPDVVGNKLYGEELLIEGF